jgi:hypothetical protein
VKISEEDWPDIICFGIAAILAVVAHFFPNDVEFGLGQFAYLAAGAALRGLGTGKDFGEP